LEIEIDHFIVMERDHAIIACGALYPFIKDNLAEIACLAVDIDYMNAGRGELLLKELEMEAKQLGVEKLFVLTTQTAHWFLEQGFIEGDIADLPVERQSLYNLQRNSKVFFKTLG